PGLRLSAPRDGARVRELLREAVEVDDAPTVVRLPKGAVQEDLEAVESVDGVDIMRRTGARDVLVVAVGPMVATCLDAAERLQAQGVGVTVVDPRWVKPVNPALVELARSHRLVVSVEDSGRVGGCGSALAQALADGGVEVPTSVFGIPQEFLQQAKRARIMDEIGLTGQGLAREITAQVSALNGHLDHPVEAPAADTNP
ncbi:MAG: transketolase C-terminal domain-containing protein, partial [Nocardioidaceae bacterium]